MNWNKTTINQKFFIYLKLKIILTDAQNNLAREALSLQPTILCDKSPF